MNELRRLKQQYKLLTQEEQPIKLLLLDFLEFSHTFNSFLTDLTREQVLNNYINYLRIKIERLEPKPLKQADLWETSSKQI